MLVPTHVFIKARFMYAIDLALTYLFDGSYVGGSKTLWQCVISGICFVTGRLGLVSDSFSKSDSFNTITFYMYMAGGAHQ